MSGPGNPAEAPALKRVASRSAVVPLTPLVDVMLILLVFFMVTSTYLDLDMIPLVESEDPQDIADADRPAPETADAAAGTILLRLLQDGRVRWRGQVLAVAGLDAALRERLAERPLTEILVLPAPRASSQALVTLLETATSAGATNLRVVRLDARP